MKGSTIASYPNDKHYCSKCADKHFNDQRLNRVILLTQIANNQPYTHAGYTDTNNTVRSWPDNPIYLR